MSLTLSTKYQSTAKTWHRKAHNVPHSLLDTCWFWDNDVLHKTFEGKQLKQVEERWLYFWRIEDPRL